VTNFGRELRAQRAAGGISQSQAAACFHGLSVRTLQAWEQGHQSPPVWAQHLILDGISKRATRKKSLTCHPKSPLQSPVAAAPI